MNARSPTDLDIGIGQRIKAHRMTIGMSQEKLAEMIGISFQQVQKYERGINRIAASRLQSVARVLGQPIEAFFEAEERS
jgi:transcriptional regulator with XRE-family HTH domain